MITTRRTVLALAAALTAPTVVVAQQPAPAPAPVPATAGRVAGPMRGRGERHPEIRKAIRALQNARVALQDAAHDFGGHRQVALDATDAALRELQLALQYDKQ